MELRQIEYFCQVAKTGSFSRAAKLMFVTQPSISAAIKNLENELETQLISYTPKKLELTEAGKHFYEKGQELLSQAADLKSEVLDLADHSSRMIHTGTSSGALSKPLAEFLALHPDYLAYSFIMPKEAIEYNLITGSLDFALCSSGFSSNQIVWEPILEESFVALVSPDSHLTRKKFVSREDLSKEKIIRYAPEFPAGDKRSEAMEKWGFQPDPAILTNEFALAVRLVNGIKGVCILSKTVSAMRKKMEGGESLVEIPLYPPIPDMTIGLARRRGHALTKAARECYEFIKDYQYE